MLWVAAFLSLIIWVLGWASGFLGLRIHLFFFCALLAVLAALLPVPHAGTTDQGAEPELPDDDPNAKSVPAIDGEAQGE